MSPVWVLEHVAVVIFAATGALAASRSQLDIVGFIFIACLTAVGGGTVRDVVLNREVFWITNPQFVVLAALAAVVVFLTAHLLESRYRALLWLDAGALAVAVPVGVGVALALEQSMVVVVVMGVATGCFGGLMRDVVCNEVPLVLKQGELYVTCAFAGSCAALGALGFGAPLGVALLVCAGVVLALRAGSLALGWRLPVYRARPPR